MGRSSRQWARWALPLRPWGWAGLSSRREGESDSRPPGLAGKWHVRLDPHGTDPDRRGLIFECLLCASHVRPDAPVLQMGRLRPRRSHDDSYFSEHCTLSPSTPNPSVHPVVSPAGMPEAVSKADIPLAPAGQPGLLCPTAGGGHSQRLKLRPDRADHLGSRGQI